MNTTAFLWFAVVSSFVLMAEARLGRPRNRGVNDWPTVFYEGKFVATRLNKAITDMKAGYHIMAVMDDIKWQKYVDVMQNTLKDYSYHDTSHSVESKFHGATGLDFSPRLVRIYDIDICKIAGNTRVKMSLVIPAISITAEGTVMSLVDNIVRPCKFEFMIDYIGLSVSSDWSTGSQERLISTYINKRIRCWRRQSEAFIRQCRSRFHPTGYRVSNFMEFLSKAIPKDKEPSPTFVQTIKNGVGIGKLLESFVTDIIW